MTDAPKKKILIVDDEEDIRTFLETLFQDNDYDTCLATNGFEAMEQLKKEKPDLITLDLMMPYETGTHFYKNLLKEDELKNIPVIVVSGLAGRHLAIRKPFAVFDKPIEREELLKAVRKALGQAEE
ncbi:MAG: response regulator [bacterium]